MERRAAELLRDALALPAESRVDLIDSLLAWRREIQARIEEIDSGAVELISWRDVRRRLRDRLGC